MTRLITAAPALITAAAVLLFAAYATVHRVRRRLSTHPTGTGTGPRRVVEDALWDWWTTTDPLEPFAPADVADRVDEYLRGSGFTIAPDLRKNRMPALSSIAAAAVIAVIAAASSIAAAWRGEWWWTLIGALATTLLTREIIRDLADRRHGSDAR